MADMPGNQTAILCKQKYQKQDNKKIKEQDRYLICPDRVKDGHFIGFICSLDESQTDR